MIKKYEDSFWSTGAGHELMRFCTKTLNELGIKECIRFCEDMNAEELLPVFKAINEKIKQDEKKDKK